MRGLAYQIKSVGKDKFCIMSFVLPVIAALVLHFFGTIDLSSVGEFHFGVLENDLSAGTISWLERYGSVTAYKTREELAAAVVEPSTNFIGVEADGDDIQTMISGDELDIFRQAADTLPALYRGQETAEPAKVTILERADVMAGFQNIFIAMTLLVAMFMGCTFNAVNMISEKENGIDFVNRILPLTQSRYVVQKISVGFVCGCLSAVFTACICFRLPPESMVLLLVLIIMSAFIAALVGLFIGGFAESFMTGVACIKIVMMVFIAVPLLNFLLGTHGFISILCYLVPSTAAFEGIMNLTGNAAAKGTAPVMEKDMLILMAHCVVWLLLYLSVAKRRKKHTGDRQRQ